MHELTSLQIFTDNKIFSGTTFSKKLTLLLSPHWAHKQNAKKHIHDIFLTILSIYNNKDKQLKGIARTIGCI